MPVCEFVLPHIFSQARAAALAEVGDWTSLHAASFEWRGKRGVLVGRKGVGKTTIAIRLLFLGALVFGDERIMIRGGTSIPYPRRFHLKERSLIYFQELDELVKQLAFVMDGESRGNIYAFAPSDIGRPWRLCEAPIDYVFFIEDNFGGQVRFQEVSDIEMMEMLMPHSTAPATGRATWIADINAIVTDARCGILVNGRPQESAIEILNRVC